MTRAGSTRSGLGHSETRRRPLIGSGGRHGGVEATTGLLVAHIKGEAQLRDQHPARPAEHGRLTGGQAVVALAQRQVPHHLGPLGRYRPT